MVHHDENSPICVYMLSDLGEVAHKESTDLDRQSDRSPVPQLPVMAPPATSTPLSKRELEVLRGLAQGLDHRTIAKNLTITESTARNHIQSILTKFGVHSRVEAVVRAYQEKLVSA